MPRLTLGCRPAAAAAGPPLPIAATLPSLSLMGDGMAAPLAAFAEQCRLDCSVRTSRLDGWFRVCVRAVRTGVAVAIGVARACGFGLSVCRCVCMEGNVLSECA